MNDEKNSHNLSCKNIKVFYILTLAIIALGSVTILLREYISKTYDIVLKIVLFLTLIKKMKNDEIQ